MNILEYLQEQLYLLSKNFSLQVKYHFDKTIGRHIVELTPQEIYYNDKKLDDYWINISIEFMQIFPQENISFISSDSTLISADCELFFDNTIKEEETHIEKIYESIMNEAIFINYPLHFNSNPNILSNFFNYVETQHISIKETKEIKINNQVDILFNLDEYDPALVNQLPQAA